MTKPLFKNKWIEFHLGYFAPAIKYCPYSYFDERPEVIVSLYFFSVYIHLPFYSGKDQCEHPQYGFYFFQENFKFPSNTFVWCWNNKIYHFSMPWHWEWIRTSTLKNDGTWHDEMKADRKSHFSRKTEDENRKAEMSFYRGFYPYEYTLKSGKTQKRTATVKVIEREWRWKWFQWLTYPRLLKKVIDVTFSDEVGERTGSWKGGTIGCSYVMRENESPEQTLRRMEKERKF